MSSPADRDSALSLDAVRRIDGLCDRFEATLQTGQRPVLEEFLALAHQAERGALLCSLLEVELEYRRAWDEAPLQDEYFARFPQEAEAIIAVFRDAEEQQRESASRPFCPLQVALANASGRRTDRLRIYLRGELVHTTALSGPLELGRQRQGETPPFAITSGPSGERLVVAPLEETTISRHHVTLVPEGQDRLRVTNLSQVNPILFSNGSRLEVDQSESFPLSLEMTVGTLFVRVDRPLPNGNVAGPGDSSSSHDVEPSGPAAVPPPGLLRRLFGWRRGAE